MGPSKRCLHTPAVQQTLNHRTVGALTANASVASTQTSITLTCTDLHTPAVRQTLNQHAIGACPQTSITLTCTRLPFGRR